VTAGSDAYIDQTGALTLLASSATNTFQLTDTTSFTLANALTARDVVLQTTAAGNGNISINVGPTASNSITLNAGGSGNISERNGVVLTAPTITLMSGTGNIGTSANNIVTNASTLLTASTSSGGSVYLSQATAVNLGTSGAGVTFQLTDPVSVRTAGNLSAAVVSLLTPNLANNNVITGTTSATVQSTASLVVSGTGTFKTPNSFFNSGASSSVDVTQDSFVGLAPGTDSTVNGDAGSSLTVLANVSNLMGGTLNARDGSISLTADRALVGTSANASLTATNNITLIGQTGANLGASSTLSAGVFASGGGTSKTVQAADTVASNGQILIDDYRGGTATGNVVIGNNVTLTARGGATIGGVTTAGSIGVQSSTNGDISIGSSFDATAWGGNLWINAGNDMTMGNGFSLSAIAKYNDDPNAKVWISREGEWLQAYIGGGVGLWAGDSSANVATWLNNQITNRASTNTVVWPPAPQFDHANPFAIQNGGVCEVILAPGGDLTGIHGTTATANGGIIGIDPGVMSFSGGAILAVAPPLQPVPPPPPPPPPGPGPGPATPPAVSGPPSGFGFPPAVLASFDGNDLEAGAFAVGGTRVAKDTISLDVPLYTGKAPCRPEMMIYDANNKEQAEEART
jgi:hypothetical protein